MTCGSIDRLRMARCRPVASAVVRRAQMRAAFDDLLWNLDVGRSGVVAAILAPAARVLRDGGDRGGAFAAVRPGVLTWKFTLPGIGHVTAIRRELFAPRKLGAIEP